MAADFFKLDEVDADDDSKANRIAADISEYIVDSGVITTNQDTYQQAEQFVSQLEDEGVGDLSTDTFEAAREAIESTDESDEAESNEVDDEVVKTALDFESIDDIDDVDEELFNALSALDVDKYHTDIRTEEVTRLIEEINERFIDDISNLFLLSYSDNPVASNNLLSKKLAVLSDDDYDTIVVNEFFQPGGGILETDDEFSEGNLEAFSGDDADISEDIVNRADQAWNYEAAFERKAKLIKTIVSHLKFDVAPDHQQFGEDEFVFGGESLEDKIESEVQRDKDRRLQRDNF